MLILPEHELAIILTPKAGSTSLERMLWQRDGIARLTVHPWRSRHGTELTHDWQHYRVAVVTRDPITRARSLFGHASQFENPRTFNEFARTLPSRNWFFWPCSKFADSCRLAGHPYTQIPVTETIRLEHLDEDLSRLGIHSAPLHEHETENPTDERIEWAGGDNPYFQWCEPDCFQYGYQFDEARRRFIEEMIAPGKTTVCEVGVQRGHHAWDVLSCRPKHLTLVDCWLDDVWPYQSANYDFVLDKFGRYDQVTILKSDSQEAARHSRKYGVVYIDADHSREAVAADLEAWWPRIKMDGWLAGHDYLDMPEYGIGVKSAVNEFAARRSLDVEHTSTTEWRIRKCQEQDQDQ